MAGFRSRESYVAKYGEDDGNVRYERLIKERDMREKRTAGGKSLTAVVDLSTPEAQQAAIDAGNALRCLECGYVGTRLQHTHFKHKCSGKVKNGEEYKKLHPGALVVAPNLAKNTGGTLENYIKLYGEEDGKKRWEVYKGKQADSNGFEYKQEKHGWTKEQFDEYNASRSSSRENFVKRHGIVEGSKMWDQYTARQRETTSLEYFVTEYGAEEGAEKYANFAAARAASSKHHNGGVSASETACYEELVQIYPSLEMCCSIFTNGGHPRPFDFGCHESKKLIEYYGTYWHCDPRKYASSYTDDRRATTAAQIWAHDAKKVKDANQNGYDVFTILELDWKRRPNEVKERLAKWWNDPKNSTSDTFGIYGSETEDRRNAMLQMAKANEEAAKVAERCRAAGIDDDEEFTWN